ncbi:PD-(D/E)XK nuclease family protein [Porphyromonas gulae]|uniref:PD-(D/E)XK nuclease family protein n=1 Tax=Porphyromonas gulae TaxID=111105 RepID=UPI000A4BD328|nr:PD-(D/E)XK nuclease family protein [Porphyromonas gulae]
MDQEKTFEEILELFAQLPKEDREPTFIEICRYPYNRQEEICSRILRFFLDPNAEHKLYDLWLSALWKASGQESDLPFYKNVSSVTEEECSKSPGEERRRIDIVVSSEKFVIAIENKIRAGLYNPLNAYKEHISNKYHDSDIKKVYIVLTLDSLLDVKSRQHIEKNGFHAITYQQLFKSVKDELGNYISGCNSKYLTYMFDFIKTLENMTNINSKRVFEFFIKHEREVKELIEAHKKFVAENRKTQEDCIASLREQISKKTQREWWVWEKFLLGISFNEEGNKIGIESYYEASEDGACGTFNIWITTWDREHWTPYKEEVLKCFKEEYTKLDDKVSEGNRMRVYLWLRPLKGKDEQQIIEKLAEVYSKMHVITQQIK